MTEPKPPIDALDEQERELARVLRALPGGEPPAALDQKILRAAANAAASSRRPRARWLASLGSVWGIGGAAAAVLALGITWQMLDPSRPDRLPRSQPVPAGAAEDTAITVDLGESTAAPTAPSPAPTADTAMTAAGKPAAPTRAPRAQVSSPAPAMPTAAMVAPPPPPPAQPSALAGAAEASHAGVQGAAAKTVDASPPQDPAELASQEAERIAADQARSRAENAAGYLADAQAARAQAARAEAKAMTPAVWLAKVRKLKAEGRNGEARNSLQLFHQYYPQYVIPADLAPLLRE